MHATVFEGLGSPACSTAFPARGSAPYYSSLGISEICRPNKPQKDFRTGIEKTHTEIFVLTSLGPVIRLLKLLTRRRFLSV